MRRRVRTLYVTELALIAEVDRAIDFRGGEGRSLALALFGVSIDGIEQRWKRRTIRDAHPAAVADIELPTHFSLEVRRVPKAWIAGIKPRHERGKDYLSESRPFWKRPACDFSARASVSNHSPISSNPSPRAVFAKPGY